MRIGDTVVRRDSPEIQGQVIALKAGQAKVYWSSHCSTLTELRALQTVPRQKHRKDTHHA